MAAYGDGEGGWVWVLFLEWARTGPQLHRQNLFIVNGTPAPIYEVIL